MNTNVDSQEGPMKHWRWTVGLLIACAAARIAAADSLWPGTPDSLYRDKKAFKIGDVLTVIVSESASASHSTDVKAQKTSSSGVSWGSQRSTLVPGQDFALGGKENVAGGGHSVRSGALTGRITVRVTEVLPNGNLVISGNRVITVNEEKQIMEIAGIVRPEDVTAENSVHSSLVADAQIKYNGKGSVAEKSRLGLFSRLLSMFWVF
ncbi:MAG: flagellar basal body L-ring protein FlgH [bacterium]